MKWAVLAFTFLAAVHVSAADKTPTLPRTLQDPETKITFYLESDNRHLAALSPEGKFLWCREVMPPPNPQHPEWRFFGWGLWGKENCIRVSTFCGTMMTYLIDKKTGKIIDAEGT